MTVLLPSSQSSPGSRTPSPQVGSQSESVSTVQSAGQQPSPATQSVRGSCTHCALHSSASPIRVSIVHLSPSSQVSGQSPSQRTALRRPFSSVVSRRFSSFFFVFLRVSSFFFVFLRFPSFPVVLEGHTDNAGRRETNLALGADRAREIGRFLQETHLVPEDQLHAIGYADTRPIATNSTDEGRRANRRVDIVVVNRLPSE